MHGGLGHPKQDILEPENIRNLINRLTISDRLVVLSVERDTVIRDMKASTRILEKLTGLIFLASEIENGLVQAQAGLLNKNLTKVQAGLDLINRSFPNLEQQRQLTEELREYTQMMVSLTTADWKTKAEKLIENLGLEDVNIGSVYLAKRSDGKYKIGKSTDAHFSRERGLESQTSVRHTMVHEIIVPFPYAIEAIIHQKMEGFHRSELKTRGKEVYKFGSYDIEGKFPLMVRNAVEKMLDALGE